MKAWKLIATCAAAALAVSAQAQQDKAVVIDFVHLGGNDCPPCVAWRATELPKLQAMPEFKYVRYTHVTKAIQSTVPPAFTFPSEVRQLQPALKEASNGWSGSPHQAILVNGKVVDYWYGTGRGEATELAAMFRALHDGTPLPRKTCAHLDTRHTCKE